MSGGKGRFIRARRRRLAGWPTIVDPRQSAYSDGSGEFGRCPDTASNEVLTTLISTLFKKLPETLPVHGYVYVIVNGLLISLNVMTGRPSWSFWPLFCWGILLACHFLYVRSANVDPDWVERRANDLRRKSYDASHIIDIQTSHDKRAARRRRRLKPRN